MPTVSVNLDMTQYVQINTAFNPMVLQALNDSVRITLSTLKPAANNSVFHLLGGKDAPLKFDSIDTNVWALAVTDKSSLIVSETEPAPVALHDGAGNPINSLDGAIDVHDSDVHTSPINEYFLRLLGTITTLTANSAAGATSITVASVAGLSVDDYIQIRNGTIERSFPQIKAIVGSVLTLDRPLDNAFSIGDEVETISFSMNVVGTISSPISYKLALDIGETQHVLGFTLGMVHTGAGDNSMFGDIVGGLANGVVFRRYDGATGLFSTLTVWKTNGSFVIDTYSLRYDDKAGGGKNATTADGRIKDRSGAIIRIDKSAGDYLELLIQDDLTPLAAFTMKAQGHIEGL